jgi:hypothetical protein
VCFFRQFNTILKTIFNKLECVFNFPQTYLNIEYKTCSSKLIVSTFENCRKDNFSFLRKILIRIVFKCIIAKLGIKYSYLSLSPLMSYFTIGLRDLPSKLSNHIIKC